MTERKFRVKVLLLVATVIASVGFGFVGTTHASACFDGLMGDTSGCLISRDGCIANSSWWTRTCTFQYMACETGAELAYADCLYSTK